MKAAKFNPKLTAKILSRSNLHSSTSNLKQITHIWLESQWINCRFLFLVTIINQIHWSGENTFAKRADGNGGQRCPAQ